MTTDGIITDATAENMVQAMSTVNSKGIADHGKPVFPSTLNTLMPKPEHSTAEYHEVAEKADTTNTAKEEKYPANTVMGKGNLDLIGEVDEGSADGEEGEEDEKGAAGPVGEQDAEGSAPAAPKKKKKRNKKKKPKSKRGLNGVTGFEEYYVDPPVTVEEHVEEQSLYDPSLDYTERIETAIQRYVARRKLDSLKKNLFDKYLAFGGIDTGPKMFGGGLDAQSLKTMNVKEIAQMTATHFVDTGKQDSSSPDFVVDFDGCLKAFFSSRLPRIFDTAIEADIKSYTGVIRNFLNYLLHHDVCPEYASQIQAARKTCDRAEHELYCIARSSVMMPGDFNIACSTLFGGQYEKQYLGNQFWANEMEIDGGMSPEWADGVFTAGFAAQASDEAFNAWYENVRFAPVTFFCHKRLQKAMIVEQIDTGLEVIQIIPAHTAARQLYDEQRPQLFYLGRLRVKTWYNPACPLPELSDKQLAAFLADRANNIKIYDLFLEDIILKQCFIGMKFECTLKKLRFANIWCFDSIRWVWCSFYDELMPNEKMIGWRKIEEKWLEPRDSWVREGEERVGIFRDESVDGIEEEVQGLDGGDVGAVEDGMQQMGIDGGADGGDTGNGGGEEKEGQSDVQRSPEPHLRGQGKVPIVPTEGTLDMRVATGKDGTPAPHSPDPMLTGKREDARRATASGAVDPVLDRKARESDAMLQAALENEEYGT